MNAVSFALALLKLVNAIMSWAEKRGHISEGKRLQIAAHLADIARSTKSAGETRAEIENSNDDEINKELMR